MSIIGNFLNAIALVLGMALDLYMWIIIARAVLSWVNPDPFNPIVRFINKVTEPALRQVRRRIPSIDGIDLSPIIIILVIFFIKVFVVNSLLDIAHQLMY